MKCPNCGNDIQDDHLICEQCGYEVQIVPDYDPETDIQFDNRVILDTDEFSINEEKNDPFLEDSVSDATFDFNDIKRRAITIVSIVVLSLLALIGVVFIILHTNSYEYKLNKIQSQAAIGKYDEAISNIENLYVHYPNESQLLFLEADYYAEMNKPDMVNDTLRRMLGNSDFDDEVKYQVYDRLIAMYAEKEQYDEINLLLENCEYTDVVTSYQNYLAMPPSFSLESGEYEDVIRLKLSANTTGTIYYTLDGSVPNTTSNVYGGPIVLESGEYTVTSIFINKYNIMSESASAKYTVIVDTPQLPVVNLETGEYNEPGMIIVDVPENSTVYYTTDRTTPTIDSVPYTGPIPIPLNTSNFSFIAITDQGICSDVVIRSYKLNFPDGISQASAVDLLKNRLIERGLLNDMSGKSSRAPGHYSYAAASAIRIGGLGDYYIIYEIHHDEAGNLITSDTTYIVEIYQGTVGILGGDAVNGFTALAL